MLLHRLVTGLSLLGTVALAHAGLPFAHPAATAAAAAPTPYEGVIIGHAASPAWKAPHANGEHPAVLVAARAVAIDPNTYRVQPPATTEWTLHSAPDTQVALVR